MSHDHSEHHLGTSRPAPKPAMPYKRSPNQSSRNGTPIRRVVLHYTTSRHFEGTVSWFLNPAAQVSAHYVIGREGQIVQMVKDDAKAWHAPSANADAIGIELSAAKGDKLTEPQAAKLRELVRYLAAEYHLDVDAFTGHRFLPQATSCPGDLWPSLAELRSWVREALSATEPTPAPTPAEPVSNARPYAPCPVPLPWTAELSRDSIGHPAVYHLQCALIGLGYLRGPASPETMVGDVFNEHVEHAVMRFQEDTRGLDNDGIVGLRTREAIQKALSKSRLPKVPETDSSVATLRCIEGQWHEGAWAGLKVFNLGIGSDTFRVASGARGAQTLRRPQDPRSVPGNLEPIPQGRYRIGSIEFANGKDNYEGSFGAGLGPVWVGLDAEFSDDREAFGFHLDANIGGAPGCFDASDTSVLTTDGWVDCADVTLEHSVAQYVEGAIIFEPPINVIRERYDGPMLEISGNKFSALVTPNHRFATLSGRSRKQLSYVVASDIEKEIRIPLCAEYDGPMQMNENEARLLVAFLADGYHEQGNKNKSAFHFFKERKIERIQTLLGAVGVAFTVHPGSDGTTVIRCARLPYEKSVDPLMALRLSLKTKRAMLEEMQFWDGSQSGTSPKKKAYYISTKYREHAEFYRLLAVTSGWGCSFKAYKDTRNDNWSVLYGMNIVENRRSYTLTSEEYDGSLNVEERPFGGDVFCLTTSTGNFMVRHRGNIFFTGNSAGCVVFRSVDDLKRFVAALRKHSPRVLSVEYGL